MVESDVSHDKKITLNNEWFNRYNNLNYSVADWYIAIARRYAVYTIYNKYFQLRNNGKTKSPLTLSHPGNKNFSRDDFMSTQRSIPDKQALETHLFLQIYLDHKCITKDIKNSLYLTISKSKNDFDSFMKKLHGMCRDIDKNGRNKEVMLEKINDIKYKLHKNEKNKSIDFARKLVTVIYSKDLYVNEFEYREFTQPKLDDIKDGILDGAITNITEHDRRTIYADATYEQIYANTFTKKFRRPIYTANILDIISVARNEPEEHRQAVAHMLTKGEHSFFKKCRQDEIATQEKSDVISSEESLTESVNSLDNQDKKYTRIIEQLKTFGWIKSKNEKDNEPPKIRGVLCYVNLKDRDDYLIYTFMLWLKRQRKSIANEKQIKPTINESCDFIKEIQNSTTALYTEFEPIKKTLNQAELTHVLCHLDYRLLCLIEGYTIEPDKITKKNELHEKITNPTRPEKEQFNKLVSEIMSDDFIIDLWRLAFCD